MFNFKLEIPTYAEWKVQMEKFLKDQPEQAKKYQDQEIGRASCRERV